jgi:hypothetical protein
MATESCGSLSFRTHDNIDTFIEFQRHISIAKDSSRIGVDRQSTVDSHGTEQCSLDDQVSPSQKASLGAGKEQSRIDRSETMRYQRQDMRDPADLQIKRTHQLEGKLLHEQAACYLCSRLSAH